MSPVKDVMTAPVFVLTKSFTKEEMSAFKAELYKPGEHDDSFDFKDFAFVERGSDTDGTLEDMWRLLWQGTTYRGPGSTSIAISIDRQSALDHRVIVADVLCVYPEDISISPFALWTVGLRWSISPLSFCYFVRPGRHLIVTAGNISISCTSQYPLSYMT